MYSYLIYWYSTFTLKCTSLVYSFLIILISLSKHQSRSERPKTARADGSGGAPSTLTLISIPSTACVRQNVGSCVPTGARAGLRGELLLPPPKFSTPCSWLLSTAPVTSLSRWSGFMIGSPARREPPGGLSEIPLASPGASSRRRA